MKPLPSTSKAIARASRMGEEGFSILESVVTAILLAIVVSGSAILLSSVNRSSGRSDTLVALDSAIDSNLAQIKDLSVRLTCCSGACTLTPPTNFGTSTSACATDDPRDDRYYFPQRDDTSTTANFAGTTTAREPDAVGQLCLPANNTAFMTPLKDAVDALSVPAGATRTTTIQPNHILEVSFTDTMDSRVVRVANVRPSMANWCP